MILRVLLVAALLMLGVYGAVIVPIGGVLVFVIFVAAAGLASTLGHRSDTRTKIQSRIF